MQKLFFPLTALLCAMPFFFSCTNEKVTKVTQEKRINKTENSPAELRAVFSSFALDTNDLSFEAFKNAYEGFLRLKESDKVRKNILTVIDFSKASTAKRMAVLDLAQKKLILQTYVAHGRNSGEQYAEKFSNKTGSLQSSLGFYLVTQPYIGKYGKSLLLEGIENGINHLARARAVVMHPADYVSEKFIKQTGRLGRSWGCPAFPQEAGDLLIKNLKGNTCLFIWHPVYADIPQKMQTL